MNPQNASFTEANYMGTLTWSDVVELMLSSSATAVDYETGDFHTLLIPVADSEGQRPWIQTTGAPIFFQNQNKFIQIYKGGWMCFRANEEAYYFQLIAAITDPMKAVESL